MEPLDKASLIVSIVGLAFGIYMSYLGYDFLAAVNYWFSGFNATYAYLGYVKGKYAPR